MAVNDCVHLPLWVWRNKRTILIVQDSDEEEGEKEWRVINKMSCLPPFDVQIGSLRQTQNKQQEEKKTDRILCCNNPKISRHIRQQSALTPKKKTKLNLYSIGPRRPFQRYSIKTDLTKRSQRQIAVIQRNASPVNK